MSDIPVQLWTGYPPLLIYGRLLSYRVAEISRLDACWNHISGSQNPADLGTRGKSFDEFRSSQLWWNGPTFLLDNADPCPVNTLSIDSTDCPEISYLMQHR